MTAKPYLPEDVIDFEALKAWQASIRLERASNCPDEVDRFIEAIAAKMRDFEPYKVDMVKISGQELKLSGMTTINSEPVYPWYIYEIPVPRMKAVDHRKWMHRAFVRRGKQGLIDYCHARCKGTELGRILDVLNVAVFRQERPEFVKVMNEINESKKLESTIDV